MECPPGATTFPANPRTQGKSWDVREHALPARWASGEPQALGRLLHEAEGLIRSVLEFAPGVGDPRRRDRAFNLVMGLILHERERHAEAAAHLMPMTGETWGGERNPYGVYSVLGAVLLELGELDEAERLCTIALKGEREPFGDRHPYTLRTAGRLGAVLALHGRHADGAELLVGALPAAREFFAAPGSGNARYLGELLAALGHARMGMREFAAAEAALLEARELLAVGFGNSNFRTRRCARLLIELYEAWHAADPGAGHDARAAQWRSQAADAAAAAEGNSVCRRGPDG